MASGTAFVAESTNGVTALVLRGRGDVQFTPSDPAEQVQVRLFGGKPMLQHAGRRDVRADEPRGIRAARVGKEPDRHAVDPAEVARAQALFDDKMPRTYNIDLRSLTAERWSLEPPAGSLIAEFRTAGTAG
jgi:hypothetical protein